MKRPNPTKEQAACDAFNSFNPVGTAVHLRTDSGEMTIEFTASKATVLSGHTAVIWLKGRSGCYKLDRVTPVVA